MCFRVVSGTAPGVNSRLFARLNNSGAITDHHLDSTKLAVGKRSHIDRNSWLQEKTGHAKKDILMSGIEIVDGKKVRIIFDAKKCIHSRGCVLSRPDVFVPNVQGEWIHPDAAAPEAAVMSAWMAVPTSMRRRSIWRVCARTVRWRSMAS